MGGNLAHDATELPHCTYDTAPGSPAGTGLCCEPAPYIVWDKHRPDTPLHRCEKHRGLVRHGEPSSPPFNPKTRAKR